MAVQSSGKLRLILDLSLLNTMVVKKSFKYEDLRTVLQIFDKGIYAFTFDLKSAYNRIDVCYDHMKYLSFKWSFGSGKFRDFAFQFLPFRLSSAPSIFSKVMRQLLKHQRSKGYSVLFYLDDGVGEPIPLIKPKRSVELFAMM